MAYEKQVWRNGDPTTPLSEDRLNHMEDGIFDAADRAESAAAAVGDDVVLWAELNPLMEDAFGSIAEQLNSKDYSRTGSTLVYRREDGTTDVGWPTHAANAANKEYVDDVVQSRTPEIRVVSSLHFATTPGVLFVVKEG